MKKVFLLLLSAIALVILPVGCSDDDSNEGGNTAKTVDEISQSDLVKAVADMYEEWTETTTIPSSLTVSGTALTLPQYQYAMASLMVAVRDGDSSPITVLSYKEASHPERDSYDADMIAVYNGPANGDYTEDLGNIAERMMAAMEADGQVPNQTLFTRGSSSIAFSTNRATVCFARAISGYYDDGVMPDEVSTEYLSAAATLKGFAEQFVSYLDVWEANIATTLSADGTHCSDNENAWENVHFIPIPYSGGYTDGKDQYAEEYKPYHTIEVDGVTYDAAQCWGVALQGILDLVTLEGSSTSQTERNTFVHTLGNGKSLSSPIPAVEDCFDWGNYPWYEKADDPCAIQHDGKDLETVDVEFMVRDFPWHLTRTVQNGKITNYICFGSDPDTMINFDTYYGNICPMREFLIAARFYKYLLDNDITDNVYDAVKDVAFDADLYGSEPVAFTVSDKSLSFDYEGGSETITVTSTDEAWTATCDADWVTVSPASGNASASGVEVTITASENTAGSRTATVSFVTASKTIDVSVTQNSVPSEGTIYEFATEYVKIIDIWEQTTGTCNYMSATGGVDSSDYPEWTVENGHYVPSDTKITVNGVEYGTADMLELALRCYLLLRGYNGNDTSSTGANSFSKLEDGVTYNMYSTLPDTHSYYWGTNPFNETGTTSVGNVTTGNGGEFRMGDPSLCDGVELAKIDVLDNWSQRACNYNKGQAITNMSGYASSQLSGYYGAFCSQRGLLTYAFFFKYLLDNELDDALNIDADQTFTTVLFNINYN